MHDFQRLHFLLNKGICQVSENTEETVYIAISRGPICYGFNGTGQEDIREGISTLTYSQISYTQQKSPRGVKRLPATAGELRISRDFCPLNL